MNEKKAIEVLNQYIQNLSMNFVSFEEFEATKCHRKAIEALEKQIPKDWKLETYKYGADADGNRWEWRTDIVCPECGGGRKSDEDYCGDCGQALVVPEERERNVNR